MTERQQVYSYAGLAVAILALGLWLADRERQHELPVAHEATQQAIAHAEKVDTAAIIAEALAQQTRAAVTPARTPLVKWAHDTITVPADSVRAEVLRYVARVDTALVQDSLALAAKDSAIAAHRLVEERQRAELVVAMNQPPPRLAVTLAGLYEPLTGTPAASAEASFRLVRSLGLIARADQRFAIGEKVRASVGITIRL